MEAPAHAVERGGTRTNEAAAEAEGSLEAAAAAGRRLVSAVAGGAMWSAVGCVTWRARCGEGAGASETCSRGGWLRGAVGGDSIAGGWVFYPPAVMPGRTREAPTRRAYFCRNWMNSGRSEFKNHRILK
jgi:hypothetical protein